MSLEWIILTVSWTLVMCGCFFCLAGGIGLIRLPDFYSRTHAASMTDTLGAALILLGFTFQAESWIVVVKLLLIQVFILLTSPTAAHALIRAAFTHGLKPVLYRQDFDFSLLEGDLAKGIAAQTESDEVSLSE